MDMENKRKVDVSDEYYVVNVSSLFFYFKNFNGALVSLRFLEHTLVTGS